MIWAGCRHSGGNVPQHTSGLCYSGGMSIYSKVQAFGDRSWQRRAATQYWQDEGQNPSQGMHSVVLGVLHHQAGAPWSLHLEKRVNGCHRPESARDLQQPVVDSLVPFLPLPCPPGRAGLPAAERGCRRPCSTCIINAPSGAYKLVVSMMHGIGPTGSLPAQ